MPPDQGFQEDLDDGISEISHSVQRFVPFYFINFHNSMRYWPYFTYEPVQEMDRHSKDNKKNVGGVSGHEHSMITP